MLALSIGVPSANAVIVHLANGKALSYQPLRKHRTIKPFDAVFSNLDYNGGPVMPANTNYTIYWSPSGAGAYPAGYREGVNRYLEDLAHDSGGHQNVDSVSSQYNDVGGEFANDTSHFGGTFVDEDLYPTEHNCKKAPICITDEQIQTELKAFVEAHGLPTGLETEYFLLTPAGVESCFEEAGEACSAGTSATERYCAYHGNAPIESGGEVVSELIYANDPYVTGILGCDDGDHPNGKPSDGAIQGGLSHEHNESITDPLPNSGWTDFATGENTGYEVGDKCDTGEESSEFGSVLGEVEVEEEPGVKVKDKYNQIVDGDFYWYQQEWSNQGKQCLQRFTFAGAEPSATFVSKPAGTNKLTFEAGASTAPGGVSEYSWQFNDKSASAESSLASVSHTFPEAGFYLVALTVYGENSTSLGSADIVATGHTSPSAAFSISTAEPAATVPTLFDASTSGGTITAYEWNFGDGSGGVGARPSHTYAQPGTYFVTLFVEDTAGQVVTVAHQVTVGSAPPPGGGGTGSSNGGGGSGEPVTPVPAPPTPAPAPPLGVGTVVLLGGTVTFAPTGSGPVKLSCVGTATCTGKLTLTIKVKARGRRPRTVTLGIASFSIAPGAIATVKLKLNATGRSRLRAAHGHLAATLMIVKSSPAPASTQTRGVRLKLKLKK